MTVRIRRLPIGRLGALFAVFFLFILGGLGAFIVFKGPRVQAEVAINGPSGHEPWVKETPRKDGSYALRIVPNVKVCSRSPLTDERNECLEQRLKTIDASQAEWERKHPELELYIFTYFGETEDGLPLGKEILYVPRTPIHVHPIPVPIPGFELENEPESEPNIQGTEITNLGAQTPYSSVAGRLNAAPGHGQESFDVDRSRLLLQNIE